MLEVFTAGEELLFSDVAANLNGMVVDSRDMLLLPFSDEARIKRPPEDNASNLKRDG